MLIELDQVRQEPYVWREVQDVGLDTLDREEVAGLTEVEFGGKITFVDPGFFLKGMLRYEQTLVCMRCLKELVEPVEADVEILLLVEEDEGARFAADDEAEEVELSEEELGVLILPEEEVDTEPILLEHLQLNVPMKPLCRPDCKGLCPRCGADLNEGECDCDTTSVDPRWAALAGLKDQLEDDDT